VVRKLADASSSARVCANLGRYIADVDNVSLPILSAGAESSRNSEDKTALAQLYVNYRQYCRKSGRLAKPTKLSNVRGR